MNKDQEKDPAAVSLGAKGGKKRWEGVSEADRSEAGKKLNEHRWGKKDAKKKK